MTVRECPNCFADLPRRARYCPRCGRDTAGGPAQNGDAATAGSAVLNYAAQGTRSAGRPASSETVVGWLLFATGGAMIIVGLVATTGVRTWLAIGFGVMMFVVGLGCLVGNGTVTSSEPDAVPTRDAEDGAAAKKEKKKKKQKD